VAAAQRQKAGRISRISEKGNFRNIAGGSLEQAGKETTKDSSIAELFDTFIARWLSYFIARLFHGYIVKERRWGLLPFNHRAMQQSNNTPCVSLDTK